MPLCCQSEGNGSKCLLRARIVFSPWGTCSSPELFHINSEPRTAGGEPQTPSGLQHRGRATGDPWSPAPAARFALLSAESCWLLTPSSCRQFKCSQRAAGRLHIHLRCLCMLTNAGHLVPTRAWLGEGLGPVPLPPWFCSLRACRSQWDLPAQTEHHWWAGSLVGSF